MSPALEGGGNEAALVARPVRALEERGVLAVKHGRGATVAPTKRWNALDPGVLCALFIGPDARSLIAEILESRRALEVEAARMAAERRSDDQLAATPNAVETLRGQERRGARRGRGELPARARRGDLETARGSGCSAPC